MANPEQLTSDRRRLSRRRLAAIVLLGPVVGSVTFFGLTLLLGPLQLLPSIPPSFAGAYFMTALLAGLAPSMLAAAVLHVMPPPAAFGPRALRLLMVGAATGIVGTLFILFGLGLGGIDIPIILAMGLCGAVALLVTALPGSAG